MIAPHVMVSFFITSVILALSPGPDNLFVLAQSAQNGRRAGYSVTLGLATGLMVHTVAVTFGLAAVVRSSALAFGILKYTGAIYLLSLAWQAFRSAAATGRQEMVPVLSSMALYRRGIVMNLANPKVSLFFIAFLPQFADPRQASMTAQFLQLGTLFILATLLVFSLIALFAGGVGERLCNSPFAQQLVNRIAALLFIAIACKLALS
ncbi:MAG: LysE family translocator [Chlorobium sp.]